MDLPDGDLQILPDFLEESLPGGLRVKVTLNAIAGPCTAHELAARRQTSVVFCGPQLGVLERLRQLFTTSYYRIWLSTDVVGVEVCAALKNAYALAVGLEVGKMEQAGPDGLALSYNPQAAVFAQSCLEMRRFLEVLGGGLENVSWLPGAGDLYVTIYGGRTVKMGKLLGQGLPYPQARLQLADETLESIEIITRVGRALPRLEARRIIRPGLFPLLQHLYRIIHHGAKPDLPWETFFRD